MHSLHTLGAVYVADESEQPLAGAATQRRTLALLALLGMAGEAGLSRDKLVGILWPEVDAERARHSLTQGLYAARRALQIEDLFIVSSGSVRLNFDRIRVDARAMEEALREERLEEVVALYGGPFLDGFFISGSPEFEQWSSMHRDRIAAQVADALERLAARADATGDLRQLLESRRRLSALLPLDSASTVRLMTAMARAGDRAGAIQQARLHATMLRTELDLEPDPVVEALAARLRSGSTWAESEIPSAPEDQPAPDEAETSAMSPDSTIPVVVQSPSLRPEITRPPPQLTIPLGVRWTILALVVFVLVGAGILIGRARRSDSADLRELAVRQRIVVAPFRVTGAHPSLSYLRDGMVELLSVRLADDSLARSVDAGAVLGAWRMAGLTTAMDVPHDTVVKLAGRLGAERVVVGSIVGTTANVMLRASVLAVPAGTVSAEASVAGPVDSLTALIERLAGQLLISEAGEDEQLAEQTTRSLPALRAFLAGQAALRQMDYAAALRHYDAAVGRDSTFALASLQSAMVSERLLDPAHLGRSIARAWQHRQALSRRDDLLLLAYAGPRYPLPSTAAEYRAAWQQIVQLAPASPDIWFALGSRLYHDGAAAELPSVRSRAAEAFQRALAASDYPPARGFLSVLGVLPPDSVAAAVRMGPYQPYARWRSAVATDDRAAIARLRDTMFRLGPANLRAIAMASQYEAIGIDDGALALEQLSARALRTVERADVLFAEHAQAVQRGRLRDALAITSRIRNLQPGSYSGRRLRVLDALYGGGDSVAASAAVRDLTAITGPDPSSDMATSEAWSANLCVLAQWRAARGDAAGLDRLMDVMARRDTVGSLVERAGRAACVQLLEAWHAVLVGSPEAPTRVQALDSLVFAPQVAGELASYAPILLSRLHERLDDPPRALAALRRRVHMMGWPTYQATTAGSEARLAERTGDAVGMRTAYARYLVLRGSPDADGAPELAGVRRRLQAAQQPANPPAIQPAAPGAR